MAKIYLKSSRLFLRPFSIGDDSLIVDQLNAQDSFLDLPRTFEQNYFECRQKTKKKPKFFIRLGVLGEPNRE